MSEPARIPIIDDDQSIRKTISMKLQHGYVVDTAEDGKQAMQKADVNFFALQGPDRI